MYRIVQHLTKVAVVLFGLLLVVMPAAAQDVAAPALAYNPSVCYAHTDGGPLSQECLAMIEAYPRPPVTDIRQDAQTIDNLSFWRVGPEATNTYDAPNGGVSGQIPEGFNFVTAIDLNVDGWLQIQGGRWIQRDIARWTQPSFFTGAEITNGLEYPFAWVLDLSRIFVSAYPGGPRSQENGRWIERYERVNIFSVATDADGWHWYMIGPNQWVEQRFVARAHRIERPEGIPEGVKWIAVDLYEQTLVAYEGDTPVFATLVSSGLPPYETNEGLFNVWARVAAEGMAGATGLPRAYDIQMVPWVMYFDEGISLHGSYWHDLFGYRQSHGCVNLTISDAKWLWDWTAEGVTPDADGNIPTPVYVFSSGEYGQATATGL